MNRVNYYPAPDNPHRTFLSKLGQSCFSIYFMTYIHECGHALSAYLLFDNANPRIRITPFGGSCTYSPSTLSILGKKLGRSNTQALTAAAGPIADILNMLTITKLTQSDRNIAQLMLMKAISLSIYSLSALVGCFDGHDFCSIWKEGGAVPYTLLSAACLATTALIYRNATRQDSSTLPFRRPLREIRVASIDPFNTINFLTQTRGIVPWPPHI